MGRQVDCHADGVNNPSEHQLDSVPAAVSFAQFLEGDRLVAEWRVTICTGEEDMVDRVK